MTAGLSVKNPTSVHTTEAKAPQSYNQEIATIPEYKRVDLPFEECIPSEFRPVLNHCRPDQYAYNGNAHLVTAPVLPEYQPVKHSYEERAHPEFRSVLGRGEPSQSTYKENSRLATAPVLSEYRPVNCSYEKRVPPEFRPILNRGNSHLASHPVLPKKEMDNSSSSTIKESLLSEDSGITQPTKVTTRKLNQLKTLSTKVSFLTTLLCTSLMCLDFRILL